MPRRNKQKATPSAKRKKRKKKRGSEDATRNALVRQKLRLGVSVVTEKGGDVEDVQKGGDIEDGTEAA